MGSSMGADHGSESINRLELAVDTMAFKGRGLGRIGGKAVFVEGAVPGDYAEVMLVRDKKNWAEAQITRLLRPSGIRQSSPCRYSGECGGCQWDSIPVQEQLRWKTDFVRDAFGKFSGQSLPEDFHIYPSEKSWFYRNRALLRGTIHRDGRVQAGFFKKATRTQIPVQECQIACEQVNTVISTLNHLKLGGQVQESEKFRVELQHFPKESSAGRASVSAMVQPVMEEGAERAQELVRAIAEIPEVFYAAVAWREQNPPILALEEDHGLTFFTSPGAFFQVNLQQNQALRHLVATAVTRFAPKVTTILDLFCGSGNLSLFLAGAGRAITGIESNAQAIRVARYAALFNKLSGVEFYTQDSRRYLLDCLGSGTRFELIIADPPRAGMKGLISELREMNPQVLIYISCDPVTMARDIGMLGDHYRLMSLQSLDFFPHTYHVESIAVLQRQ